MWFAHILSNCPRTSFCSVGRSTAHTDSRHGPLKDVQDDITAHNAHKPLHEPQAHGISMKTSSTPSRRAMSSSFSARHICRVLVTACRALSLLHSRHTLGISCRGMGQGW